MEVPPFEPPQSLVAKGSVSGISARGLALDAGMLSVSGFWMALAVCDVFVFLLFLYLLFKDVCDCLFFWGGCFVLFVLYWLCTFSLSFFGFR